MRRQEEYGQTDKRETHFKAQQVLAASVELQWLPSVILKKALGFPADVASDANSLFGIYLFIRLSLSEAVSPRGYTYCAA